MAAMRFRSNKPRMVDETVDGETLIIDMVSGSYFSCVGASAAAWIALSHGATAAETARLLSATYRIATSEAERDVEQFVATLLGDEVLVVLEEGDPTNGGPPALDTPGHEYQPLRLERYTDLADLILLDPVHDVSVAGWPSRHE